MPTLPTGILWLHSDHPFDLHRRNRSSHKKSLAEVPTSVEPNLPRQTALLNEQQLRGEVRLITLQGTVP
jgi:hypothetical protein